MVRVQNIFVFMVHQRQTLLSNNGCFYYSLCLDSCAFRMSTHMYYATGEPKFMTHGESTKHICFLLYGGVVDVCFDEVANFIIHSTSKTNIRYFLIMVFSITPYGSDSSQPCF